MWLHTPLTQLWGGRGMWSSITFEARLIYITCCVPDQPRLYTETLSQKKRKERKGINKRRGKVT
jgi:hypothetical protein